MDANRHRPRRAGWLMPRCRRVAALGILFVLIADAPALSHTAAVPSPSLTAQQQQQMAALEATSRAKADQLIAQIGQIRGRLFGLYDTYSLDAVAASRLDGELNRVQAQLLDLRLSEQKQLRVILSPDQFAQLRAAIQGHGDWGGHHRRDRRGGDHDGDGPHEPGR